MEEGKEILKFDGGEEIKPCTECTYLGIKMDKSGENTTEIKHRISQTRKVINVLIPIGGTKVILKTENYTFIRLYFRAFWCMVHKYGKSLLEK